jgi:hypothetical protein
MSSSSQSHRRIVISFFNGSALGVKKASGPCSPTINLARGMSSNAQADRLDWDVRDRLKTDDQFQWARYELAVAAIFIRSGFDIEWLDQRKGPGKRCEFIATHRLTGEVISVEAKSRHRAGRFSNPVLRPISPACAATCGVCT